MRSGGIRERSFPALRHHFGDISVLFDGHEDEAEEALFLGELGQLVGRHTLVLFIVLGLERVRQMCQVWYHWCQMCQVWYHWCQMSQV